MTNIISFKHRKFCDLFPSDYYPAEITKSNVVSSEKGNAMTVDFLVDGGNLGKRTVTKWFNDSEKESDLKARKQLFTAVGHPEYFDLDTFNVSLLVGSKLMVKLGQWTNEKTNETKNVFNEFIQAPFSDNKQTSLNEDLPF